MRVWSSIFLDIEMSAIVEEALFCRKGRAKVGGLPLMLGFRLSLPVESALFLEYSF